MKNFLLAGFSLLVFVFALLIDPVLIAVCVNGIAKAGGSAFHIPFTFRSWIYVFSLLLLLRGFKRVEKK